MLDVHGSDGFPTYSNDYSQKNILVWWLTYQIRIVTDDDDDEQKQTMTRGNERQEFEEYYERI